MENIVVSTETGGKVAREVFLTRPMARSRSIFRPLIQQLKAHLVTIPIVVLAVALYAALEPFTDYAFAVVLAIAVAGLGLYFWWGEFHRPRRQAEQRRTELLSLAQQHVKDIAFSDGSVGDFVPDGVILLKRGWAIAFDTERRLIRQLIVKAPGRLDMDWLWGWEERPRFEVTELRRRRFLGDSTEVLFGIALPSLGRTLQFPIEPGFEAAARRLTAAANKAIARS